jgi:hypothetical protein
MKSRPTTQPVFNRRADGIRGDARNAQHSEDTRRSSVALVKTEQCASDFLSYVSERCQLVAAAIARQP